MALELGSDHVLAAHVDVGKGGGAERSNGPRIYDNILDIDSELNVQMGTQAHAWWGALINWCVVANEKVSQWVGSPGDLGERALALRELKMPNLQYAGSEECHGIDLAKAAAEDWQERQPVTLSGLVELAKQVAVHPLFKRCLIFSEAGVQVRVVSLTRLEQWFKQPDEGEFAVEKITVNTKGKKIPQRDLIVTQHVSLERVGAELKLKPGEMLKQALIKKESLTEKLISVEARQKLSALLHKDLSSAVSIEEFFLHHPDEQWLLDTFKSERLTWQELERIYVAKVLTRARAEMEFLIPGRPKFKDTQEIWEIIKDFWPEEGSLKMSQGKIDWRKFAVHAIPLKEKQPKVIKAAIGGCPDGFMIDPGEVPTEKSSDDLEKIRQFVARFYRRGEKQPSIWQNIEFIEILREGIEKHGWQLVMYEIKVKASGLPKKPEPRYVNELVRYCTILTNSINGIVAVYRWLRKEKTPKEIDPIIRAFTGAYLFYVGDKIVNNKKQGAAAIFEVFGNPLLTENRQWLEAIKLQRQKLLQAVRVALVKKKIDEQLAEKEKTKRER